MKHTCLLIAGLMVLGLAVSSDSAATNQSPATTKPSSAEVTQAILAIDLSAEPSATVQAFANAIAIDRTDALIYQAYCRRMADFGMPELALTQAKTLIGLQPDNGIGWGVVASAAMRRGDNIEALSDILQAVRHAPNEALILRTAGQLVAWFESYPKNPQVTDIMRSAVAQLKTQLSGKSVFADAYKLAMPAYRLAKARAEGSAAGPGPLASVAPQGGGIVYRQNPGLTGQPIYPTSAPPAGIPQQYQPPPVMNNPLSGPYNNNPYAWWNLWGGTYSTVLPNTLTGATTRVITTPGAPIIVPVPVGGGGGGER
ncbi:MAG: hypothetical protein ACE15C_21865 [Phycisphaerae bacterium]